MLSTALTEPNFTPATKDLKKNAASSSLTKTPWGDFPLFPMTNRGRFTHLQRASGYTRGTHGTHERPNATRRTALTCTEHAHPLTDLDMLTVASSPGSRRRCKDLSDSSRRVSGYRDHRFLGERRSCAVDCPGAARRP
ncbi:hypothetical protein ACFPRL_23355 [Pseudoclavibacter helvolus]